MSKSNKEANFGFRKVTQEIKTNLVKEVFSSVASKYDLMNDVMSLGIHRLWKNHLINKIPVIENANIIDMAGGTGDIAFKIFQKYNKLQTKFQLKIADYNEEMILAGKDRAIDQNIIGSNVSWHHENGEKTSFKANEFDLYTIAYGIRNFADLEQGVKEASRILKKNGKFFCLEFNQVENEMLKKIYDFYSFNFIPQIGGLITGDKASYEYFVESIRTFPKSSEFAKMLKDNGFKEVKFEKLTLGLTTLYYAEK